MSAIASYVDREDSSAVDKALHESALRNHEWVRAQRARTFSLYARYVAFTIAATGGSVFLILWGVSLLNETPEPKIIETEVVVERPVAYQPSVYIEGPLKDSPQATMHKIAEAVKSQTANLEMKGIPSPTVYNYVIFKEVTLTEGTADGFETLTIAMEFSDSNKKVPTYQECFIQREGANATARKISLAFKEEGVRRDPDITQQMAYEGGTTVRALETAQVLCQFM